MKNSEEIQCLLDFAEGRLEPKKFESILYANPRFEAILNDNPRFVLNAPIWGNFYLYVIEQNYNSPGGVLNAHATLTEFLESKGIIVRPTEKYRDFHWILLTAQPKWLNVDGLYIQQNILVDSDGRQGKELKDWLKSELLKRFRYDSKPPRWIQSPNWPINENGPLLFLGQVKVLHTFHDEAAIYVFFDAKSGQFHNVYQAY